MVNNSRLRVVFFGTPDFAATILSHLQQMPEVDVGLVVTRADKPAGRGKKLTPPPVKRLAEEFGIPVLQPGSIRKNEEVFLAEVKSYGDFDLGVVVAFGQILPQCVLDLPASGCVNVHASLLPRWRGAAPIQRAIMSGDTHTGICLMRMEAGLDTGPVYSRVVTEISESDTAGALHDRLALLGAQLLTRDILGIGRGSMIPEPQPTEGVTYAEKISNDEACIDWSKDAVEISNLIRGLSPFPGAFTTLRGLRLKIYGAHPRDTRGSSAVVAGKISLVDSHTLEVQCGNGVVLLGDLQLEGRKRLSVTEFLKGVEIQPGVVLGSDQ